MVMCAYVDTCIFAYKNKLLIDVYSEHINIFVYLEMEAYSTDGCIVMC